MFSDMVFRLRALFRRATIESELDDELRFHFDEQVGKYVGAGLTPEEAVRRARLLFGGIDQVKEECRDARGIGLLGDFLQDLRYGARLLRAKPLFTLVAVLTLALGVGATTAVFSIVNAVLLRSLPYADPGRLMRIFFDNRGVGLHNVTFSVPELEDLRTRAGVFDSVSACGRASVNLTGAGQPERLEMLVSSPNYFSLLGATPQIGRLFGPHDFALGFAPVAVLSDEVWRRSYGADPGVLGRTLRLDNDPYTIIGVLRPGFRHPAVETAPVDIWLTAGFAGDPAPKPARGTRFLPSAIGRLKPGITVEQAQARLTAMAAEIRHDYPGDYPVLAQWSIGIRPLRESMVGQVRPMLLILLGAVVLIVFIVALNIANLLLARASGRQQEIAVRLALGASRRRMLRQMLTESLLLSSIGGIAGVATAVSTLKLILRFVPSSIPRLTEVSIDWRVLTFAVALSVSTGLLFGAGPAMHAARASLAVGIREGGRGSSHGMKTGRLRDLLIVAELALAVVLMIGAGLLLHTLRDLLIENPGYNPEHVVAAHVNLPMPNDPKLDPYLTPERQIAFNRELVRRLKAIPEVQIAALTSALPTIAPVESGALAIEDRPVESSADLRAEMIRVSPDYFHAIEAPLVRGRFFAKSDQAGKPLVAIIDEATARRYWPDQDPLGRRLRFGQNPLAPWMTVVGVVRDIKSDGLDVDGVPHIYVSFFQHFEGSASVERELSIVVRTTLSVNALEPRIRQEIQSIDPSLPVFQVSSMDELIDTSLASRRFSAELVGGFAAMALVLASIGVYALLAFMVGQRAREIGLRMALGARRGDILRMVVTKGAALAAWGTIAGVLFSASAAPILASLLYGVQPHDPVVFAGVPLLLFSVATLASFLPARRAAKVDPAITLRES